MDLSSAVLWPVGFGLLGLLASLMVKRADPANDTVRGAFRRIFMDHSLSTSIAALTYFGVCAALHERDALTYFGCFAGGYMVQDVAPRLFGAWKAKHENGD